jgi:uncharacterized protein YhaN
VEENQRLRETVEDLTNQIRELHEKIGGIGAIIARLKNEGIL